MRSVLCCVSIFLDSSWRDINQAGQMVSDLPAMHSTQLNSTSFSMKGELSRDYSLRAVLTNRLSHRPTFDVSPPFRFNWAFIIILRIVHHQPDADHEPARQLPSRRECKLLAPCETEPS